MPVLRHKCRNAGDMLLPTSPGEAFFHTQLVVSARDDWLARDPDAVSRFLPVPQARPRKNRPQTGPTQPSRQSYPRLNQT